MRALMRYLLITLSALGFSLAACGGDNPPPQSPDNADASQHAAEHADDAADKAEEKADKAEEKADEAADEAKKANDAK
jgi:hypothetical protein